jgi:multicomponent Na+:H+ antiporter subunit D
MIKIWTEVFWKKAPNAGSDDPAATALPPVSSSLLLAPIALTAVLIVGIGLAAGMFFPMAFEAGHQLMNPGGYVQAVLGVQ